MLLSPHLEKLLLGILMTTKPIAIVEPSPVGPENRDAGGQLSPDIGNYKGTAISKHQTPAEQLSQLTRAFSRTHVGGNGT